MFPFLFFWLLFFTYQYNYFHTVDEVFFEEFQQDSESLVLGGIIADRIDLEKHGWNLGYVNFDHPDKVKTQYNFFSLEIIERALFFAAKHYRPALENQS